ncbi:MAG: cation:proton antiporter [Rikenellaceae bacterium]
MLTSIAYILLLGLFLGYLSKKLGLPPLIGMLASGIILGPYGFNLLADSLLNISADLRKLALVIILIRAGLALNIKDLKKVGLSALLMSFVPACLEIIGVIIIAPLLFDVSLIEAALLGSVLAAVSPAVIVPKMLYMIENKIGTKKSIPQMIMAGASVDDIFVIVLFSVFSTLTEGGDVSISSFGQIPLSIISGIGIGAIFGYILTLYFKNFHIRDSVKLIIMLSVSFILVAIENATKNDFSFSSLLAIMTMSVTILSLYSTLAKRISPKFSKLWIGAEVLLFVLVGATLNLEFVKSAGINSIILIFAVLIFRVFGVFLSTLKAKITLKERLFCMIAYIPKATVQAAIGAIPLSMGLACGNVVLTVAIVSIVITAPLGAFLIEKGYKLIEK